MNVHVNVDVKISAPHISHRMGSQAPPSTPDRSTPAVSGTPPPIPYSTRPLYSPLLGNIANPLHSRTDGETRTDDDTTVLIGDGLSRNPINGNPTQQRSFPVSSSARWNFPSQASPSHAGRSGRYQHYVVTVGKRTGVFDDWSFVSSLTQGVSMASHKKFRTYSEAINYYERAKATGLVWIAGREHGDEVVFGPQNEAMQ